MIDDKFQVVKHLGEGSFADVKLVQDTQTEQIFACKIFNDNSDIELIKKECFIASKLKHKHIVNTFHAKWGKYDK